MQNDNHPICPVCGGEMHLAKCNDECPEENTRVYHCDTCGMHVETSINEDDHGSGVPCGPTGYDGYCTECGSHIVWGGDFMRSDFEDDIEDDGDDALVADVSCPCCGATASYFYPSDNERKELKYWKDVYTHK